MTNPKHLTGRQKSGHAGGSATAARHGHQFYVRIGRKGGKAKKRPSSTPSQSPA